MNYVLGIIAGSLAWLDRVYVFQAMLSRPIIVSIILGAILGEMQTALICGAALELLWLNTPPVGSFLPQDESFCCAAVTPAAIIATQWVEPPIAAGFAILLGLPTASIGRRLDIFIRKMNGSVSRCAANDIEIAITKSIALSLLRSFMLVALVLGTCFAVLAVSAWVVLPFMPSEILAAIGYIPLLSIIIGVAAILGQGRKLSLELGMFAAGMGCVILWTNFM